MWIWRENHFVTWVVNVGVVFPTPSLSGFCAFCDDLEVDSVFTAVKEHDRSSPCPTTVSLFCPMTSLALLGWSPQIVCLAWTFLWEKKIIIIFRWHLGTFGVQLLETNGKDSWLVSASQKSTHIFPNKLGGAHGMLGFPVLKEASNIGAHFSRMKFRWSNIFMIFHALHDFELWYLWWG